MNFHEKAQKYVIVTALNKIIHWDFLVDAILSCFINKNATKKTL